MNTGVQRSSATPPAARTATTPAVGPAPGNVFGTGKNVPLIAMAHAHSLCRDRERLQPARPRAQGQARDGDPRRALHSHPRAVPARLGLGVRTTRSSSRGWRSRPDSSRCSKRETAKSRRARRSGARSRSTEYLKLQKRFAHLFRDPPDVERIARIQAIADRNIADFGLLRRGTHDDGKAVRDHARCRLEPRQQDRLVAHRAGRSTSTACRRATTPAPPARTSRAGCTTPRAGDYEAAWRALTDDNPLPAIMGRVCYHPCEDRVQPRQARRGGRHQLGRALSRRRGAQARLEVSRRRQPRAASACWSSAPDRRDCPRRITCGASATRSRSSRPGRSPAA